MAIEKILIVDDELLIRNFLTETLRRKGYETRVADGGKAAFAALRKEHFDLVITDMKMPDTTGIDVLRRVKELSPETVVVIITAFGTIENAVEAMRLGAFNYLIKPFTPDTIEAVIAKASEHRSLVEENSYLRQAIATAPGSRSIQRVVAEGKTMKKIMRDVAQIAKSNAAVFITGESGTGKEVIAHAIHHSSPRAGRSYIRVNCAAVPDALVESEFFGHEKGAFTGAQTKRIGRFELAHTGSLLLDEITEIPMGMQSKLLRAIQEQEFERVGGSKSVSVDVRLISTSNRNLKESIRRKEFREDLYYRLNVIPIHLPPLRDRTEEILPLADYFLERMCQENHKPLLQLSSEAKKQLQEYPWPGNIRELANVIERAVVMESSKTIGPDSLFLDAPAKAPGDLPVGISLQELERRLIIETLERHSQNRTKTAETLGISVRTLRNKLHEYGLMAPGGGK